MSTPADILSAIFEDLTAWVAPQGGTCALTQNPFDLLSMLTRPPSGWRLTIHWSGDQPSDQRDRQGAVVDSTFRFVVDGQLGPTAIPKIAMIQPSARRAPLMAILEAVRFHLACYRFNGLTPPNNALWYRGTNDAVPLPDGMSVAAWNLEFMLRATRARVEENETINLGAQ